MNFMAIREIYGPQKLPIMHHAVLQSGAESANDDRLAHCES